MRVSEERLTAVLTRDDHTLGLQETNPVAALILESMAVSHPRAADDIRDAGAFLLDLMGANEPEATILGLPIAMQVLARDEAVSPEKMRLYFAGLAEKELLLGLSIHAVMPNPRGFKRKRTQREQEAVLRTLYLLLRMFDAQEESDALDRAFGS